MILMEKWNCIILLQSNKAFNMTNSTYWQLISSFFSFLSSVPFSFRFIISYVNYFVFFLTIYIIHSVSSKSTTAMRTQWETFDTVVLDLVFSFVDLVITMSYSESGVGQWHRDWSRGKMKCWGKKNKQTWKLNRVNSQASSIGEQKHIFIGQFIV